MDAGAAKKKGSLTRRETFAFNIAVIAPTPVPCRGRRDSIIHTSRGFVTSQLQGGRYNSRKENPVEL